MTNPKRQQIIEGARKYILDNFSNASKLGYLEVSSTVIRENKIDMTFAFGAGWSNTPYHDELIEFCNELGTKIRKKYPDFLSIGYCGYTSGGRKRLQTGGLISDSKLVKQMAYPEKY